MQMSDHLHAPATWPALKTPVPTAQEAVWPQNPSGRKEDNSLPCQETSSNSPSLDSAWSLYWLRHPDSTIFPGLHGGKKRTAINKILSPHIANVFEITNAGYENVIPVFTHKKDTLCTSITRCHTTPWRSSSVLRSFYDVLTPCNGTSWTNMRVSARIV